MKTCLSCKWYHGFRGGQHRCGHDQMCLYYFDAISEYVEYIEDPEFENFGGDCRMWGKYVHPSDIPEKALL